MIEKRWFSVPLSPCRFFITGSTGSGKSVFLENVEFFFNKNGWKVCDCFDLKGQRGSLKKSAQNYNEVVEGLGIEPEPFNIEILSIEGIKDVATTEQKKNIDQFISFRPETIGFPEYCALLDLNLKEHAQTIRSFKTIFNNVHPEDRTASNLQTQIDKSSILHTNVRNSLILRLDALIDWKLISQNGLNLTDIFLNDKISVFSNHLLNDEALMRGIASIVSSSIFSMKQKEVRDITNRKFLLTFDEIASLYPKGSNLPISKNVGTLFRLGRGYDIATAVASQFPSDVADEIFGNTDIFVLFNIKNSKDIAKIKDSLKHDILSYISYKFPALPAGIGYVYVNGEVSEVKFGMTPARHSK